ncbi:4-alpha-glucanotransferase [Hoylesella nanceiensis]
MDASNITFHIQYSTTYGEELLLNLVYFDKKGAQQTSIYRMKTYDGHNWRVHIQQLPSTDIKVFHYYYSVEKDAKVIKSEWQVQTHLFYLNTLCGKSYEVFDIWTDAPQDTYLYSSAFTNCINQREIKALEPNSYDITLRLVVHAPQLRSFERLAIVGNLDVLGAWNINKALAMTEQQHNEWVIDINASSFIGEKIEFKFVAINTQNQSLSLWETENNRSLSIPIVDKGKTLVYSLNQAFFDICDIRLAGTLIPLFSLRTNNSFGIGDFGDLKRMIDFMSCTNQRVLQLLPINDTTASHTWKDSYPYSCVSVFALHPQYINLKALPSLKDEKLYRHFQKLQKELNGLESLDYEKVNNAKNEYLSLLYKQEGAKILASKEFAIFFENNQEWLVPYARFCSLRDQYKTPLFSNWGEHKQWKESWRKPLSNPKSKEYKEVAYYYFVQYLLFSQMQEAHAYALHKQVILKGDIPIGVDRHSCDVWVEPKYFNLNSQAGAPPDAFSANGQNWGFPTYNWSEMLKDNCAWWTKRFQHMSQFFDAYRIDHVLGFFRIWSIPYHSIHGLLGQFEPALGLSKDEIEAYGLRFQEKLFTTPFIAEWVIERVFKEHSEEVKEKYLELDHDDIYRIKPAFDTQRKIAEAFEGKHSDKDNWLREGLFTLVSNVLFIQDNHNPHLFHPRITAQQNHMYEALWQHDKDSFNRLYEDYYYKRNNQYWYCEAMKKLPTLVQATKMLVCAEDLGMVPTCVQWVMNELRIFSLEIQSMPKDFNVRFGHLNRNPYRSVATISTHDMSTLRLWWDENEEQTQDYYNNMLYHSGKAPHPLTGQLAQEIIEKHLQSPSALCVISLQDWLSMNEKIRLSDPQSERINIPSNPNHYWKYRMHITIEDLIANHELVNSIAEMIRLSGR